MFSQHSHCFSADEREHLGRMRYAAAGFIKCLLQARASTEPRFLSEEDRARWGVSDAALEHQSTAYLLRQAQRLRERFETTFLGRQDSVPSPDASEAVQWLDRLLALIAGFVCGDLDAAIVRADGNESVDWDSLCRWGALRELRGQLDDLPPPPPPQTALEEEENTWAKPSSPKELARIFGVSRDTMVKMLKNNSVRNQRISDRLYRVHIGDLPREARRR